MCLQLINLKWNVLEYPAAKLFLFLLSASREKLLAQTATENCKKKGYVVRFFFYVSVHKDMNFVAEVRSLMLKTEDWQLKKLCLYWCCRGRGHQSGCSGLKGVNTVAHFGLWILVPMSAIQLKYGFPAIHWTGWISAHLDGLESQVCHWYAVSLVRCSLFCTL